MSEIRVYEAARKLNMPVEEYMGLLARRGVEVKSPISIISQEVFDEVLSSLSGGTAGEEQKSAEKDRGRLSLVTPQPASASEPEGFAHEADEDEDSTAPVAEAAPVPPKKEPTAPSKLLKGAMPPISLSYVSVTMAAIALLAALVLGVATGRNSSSITALDSAVQVNQSAISETKASLADLKSALELQRRAQAKVNITERAATIEELSIVMPGATAERLKNLAAGLNSLAAGM
ncbi:MAG: translation initiation factor IF-2 N-terminal domain-containing protein [Nitrospinae bacterium]|nr:translation initiation factor IF-2 N-terminal domain-containing protein [Nitrospinota bacterium]